MTAAALIAVVVEVVRLSETDCQVHLCAVIDTNGAAGVYAKVEAAERPLDGEVCDVEVVLAASVGAE